jgi:uncharacterized protein YqgC (DUF456 family)
MSLTVNILAILIMLVGLLGSVVPILPGLPVIWAAYLGYGFFDGWESYGLATMIVTGLVVALSVALDQLASMWGTKRLGGSKAGMIGSVLGGLAGLILLSLPGLVLGAFGGAVVFELLYSGQELKESLMAGAGAILGLFCGGLAKFALGSILIMAFVWMTFFGG